MIDERKTTTSDALLGMLTMGATSGYELKQRIERSIGNFWSESYGQIYPTLKRLEREGLVESAGPGAKSGAKAKAGTGKKIYSITAAGRESLGEWLEVSPRHRGARNELLLKLFFGALAPAGSLRAHVMETRARYAADLHRYRTLPRLLEAKFQGNPGIPYWLTTVRYGIAEAEMIVAWCDETLLTLDRLDAGKAARGAESVVGGEGIHEGARRARRRDVAKGAAM